MRFSAVAVAVNCALALSLFPCLGAPGIAIAEATAGWISTILLFVTLLRRGHLALGMGARCAARLCSIVAAAIMGGRSLLSARRLCRLAGARARRY